MVKKFLELISEQNHLSVFDIDDTLFHTTAKVHVKKGDKTVQSLSNSEYNTHKLTKGHKYDFSEFRSADKFSKESRPISGVVNRLKSLHSKVKSSGKGKVILNTARGDFDDKDKFLGTFKKHGIDIDNIHVHRAGNVMKDNPQMSTGEAKNIIIKKHLDNGDYTHVSLYDDSKGNLDKFHELEQHHPKVKFKSYHIQKDGMIKRHK